MPKLGLTFRLTKSKTMSPVWSVYRKDVLMVSLIDLAIGLGWLLGSPNRCNIPAYFPARALLSFLPYQPMRYYGVLMALGALCLLVSQCDVPKAAGLYSFARSVQAAQWLFWVVLFAMGTWQGASFVAVVLPIGWTIRHYRLPVINPSLIHKG